MEKPYKISLLLAFCTSVVLLILSSGAQSLQHPLSYVFFGAVFFLVLGAVYAGSYFVFRGRRFPFPGFLISSALLTAFLFYMDYTVWDKNPPNPGWKQIVFESIFVGSIYDVG